MIFYENCLLADNSHEKSYLIFFQKLGKLSQNLSSAAVMIGALMVNFFLARGNFYHLLIAFANSLEPDQEGQNVGPDLDPKPFTL